MHDVFEFCHRYGWKGVFAPYILLAGLALTYGFYHAVVTAPKEILGITAFIGIALYAQYRLAQFIRRQP